MHLKARVEDFFFPCSRIVRQVRQQHDVTMEELKLAASKLEGILCHPKICEVVEDAFCNDDKQEGGNDAP